MYNRAFKEVKFLGSSLKDLKSFPERIREELGFELSRVQAGVKPADFKAIPIVRKSAMEICVGDMSSEFRMIYVTTFERFIYVLHCFQKKTQKTSRKDIQLAKRRYRELLGGFYEEN